MKLIGLIRAGNPEHHRGPGKVFRHNNEVETPLAQPRPHKSLTEEITEIDDILQRVDASGVAVVPIPRSSEISFGRDLLDGE